MPLPGAGDNLVQLSEVRLPSQLLLDLLGAGHQHRGIARPPLEFLDRNRLPGDSAHRLADLEHSKALTVTDVVDQPALMVKRLKCQEVGVGEIADMNIV